MVLGRFGWLSFFFSFHPLPHLLHFCSKGVSFSLNLDMFFKRIPMYPQLEIIWQMDTQPQ